MGLTEWVSLALFPEDGSQNILCNFYLNAGRWTKSRVVPSLRRLVPGLSSRRHAFNPSSVPVGLVVGKVALGRAFLRVLPFYLVLIIPTVFRI
jgi:hypothetical protein